MKLNKFWSKVVSDANRLQLAVASLGLEVQEELKALEELKREGSGELLESTPCLDGFVARSHCRSSSICLACEAPEDV